MTAIRRCLLLLVLLHLTVLSARAATWTIIDFPGAQATGAAGINSAGDIVGYYFLSGYTHGFLLKDNVFTTIDFPGATTTVALSINDSGEITGSYSHPDGLDHGFLFDGQNYTVLDFPGAVRTQATGINNATDIVGSYIDSHTSHGFKWSSGVFVAVDNPNYFETALTGINNKGKIAGGSQLGKRNYARAFLLNSKGKFRMLNLDFPLISANGINDNDIVVGIYYEQNNRTHGFKFNARTKAFFTLDFQGTETDCTGINRDGLIVGASGNHGFVRKP